MPFIPPVYFRTDRPWIPVLTMGAAFCALGGLIFVDVWLNAPPGMPNEAPILESMGLFFVLGLILVGGAVFLKRSQKQAKTR